MLDRHTLSLIEYTLHGYLSPSCIPAQKTLECAHSNGRCTMQEDQKTRQKQEPTEKNDHWNLCFTSTDFIRLMVLMLYSGIVSASEINGDTVEEPWSVKQWTIQTSVYTWHWNPEPDHNNQQHMIAVEGQFNNEWLVGVTAFRNSFDQSSQLVYAGMRRNLFNSDYFYFKLMGGLIHGYKRPNHNKIPLNGLGIAPVILPALGFRYQNLMLETTFAGIAAVTVTMGISF